ncbi:MAG: FAD-binding oxidoreductase [Candidatus Omnitrophica bacterium]|nr:FAD-binding oxidoreductase [Candidatus Omnitrophota bacterium]
MIIKTENSDIQSYLEDTANISGRAEILYITESKKDLIEAVSLCRKNKTPLTVVAGKTGTTGGCVSYSGALVSTLGLNKVLNIDQKTSTVTALAGATIESLEGKLNQKGLTQRAIPTEPLATIGGAVSTSASGVRGYGYGSIRNHVVGLEVVLSSGEILAIERGKIFSDIRYFKFNLNSREYCFKLPTYIMPSVKTQAGYYVKDNMDLIDLFIGSEGTLGIIYSVTLKVQKLPYKIFDGLIFFSSEEDSLSFVKTVKSRKKIRLVSPSSLEFFDERTLSFIREDYPWIQDAKSAVYFDQETLNEEDFDRLLDIWAEIIEQSLALADKTILADTFDQRRKVFEFRHKIPQKINEVLRQTERVKVAADIAVSDDKFDEMYSFYKEQAQLSGIDYVNFGHIGENHLHFNFLPKDEAENRVARDYLKIFCEKAVSLGGTVSAEHGIGKIKKPYLKILYQDKYIKEMVELKKYFDPNCLFGLDNIFDKELLF